MDFLFVWSMPSCHLLWLHHAVRSLVGSCSSELQTFFTMKVSFHIAIRCLMLGTSKNLFLAVSFMIHVLLNNWLTAEDYLSMNSFSPAATLFKSKQGTLMISNQPVTGSSIIMQVMLHYFWIIDLPGCHCLIDLLYEPIRSMSTKFHSFSSAILFNGRIGKARDPRVGPREQGERGCRGDDSHGGVGGRRTAVRHHEAAAC